MGYGVEKVYAKTEMDFVAPPSHGLWFWDPDRGGGSFVIFKDLPQLKAAVTREWKYHRNCDVRIYEHLEGEWVLMHEIERGTDHKQHPLWKKPSKTGPKQVPPTKSAVDEAIESIMKAGQ